MARPDAYIGTSEAVDRLIVLKQCPVTNGLPTRMTKNGFEKACGEVQKNQVAWTHGHNFQNAKPTWCAVCKGKKKPAELEIIPLGVLKTEQEKGESEMSAKKRGVHVCGCCGQTKAIVSQCSGDLVCSVCASMYGTINKRPEIVVKAINKLRPDLLNELAGSESVPVHVESSALKAIAEIVGYAGEDGDQLLERVRLVTNDAALPRDLIKALDCAADDWEMAAIQTAAMLDYATGQHVQDCTTIQRQAYDLGSLAQGADRMREQLERLQSDHARIKDEYAMTTDRLIELEQQLSANMQVFVQLADLVDGSPEYPAELPSRFSALLSKKATDAVVGENRGRDQIQPSSALDSHLLDLVLDFPGIPLERIAVIREAV